MYYFEHPKVTVLVPCYNVEKFLPQCLNSLVKQSLKELQIVCINDGSTDATLEILRAYQASDPRIEIIDKPNSGYGASMNRGLDVARGEYIGIVESDDFAEKRMFGRMYAFAHRHNCDLVKSNYNEYSAGGKRHMRPFDGYPYRFVFDPEHYVDIIRVLPIIWAGLYRRQMLVENGIRFLETPGASFQDTSFVDRVWFVAERVALLRDGLINYRVDNVNSSVKSSNKIYEVCNEFAITEEFLDARPEKKAVFGPMLNVVKMATYRWNYERIAPESRLEFCREWAQEFRAADAQGMLDRQLFGDLYGPELEEILADHVAFCEAHMDGFAW